MIRGEILGISPLVVPGVVFSLLLATVLATRAARMINGHPLIGWLIIASLGGIASFTLSPHQGAPDPSLPGFCDLRFPGFLPLSQMFTVNDRSLNVALYVPLGLVVALLPRPTDRPIALALAVLLPIGVEFTQGLLTFLNRACQLQDVADNASGLAIGAMVGSILLFVVKQLGSNVDRRDTDPRT